MSPMINRQKGLSKDVYENILGKKEDKKKSKKRPMKKKKKNN